MAENKQYITQPQENGCVLISEDVVSGIVLQALTDIDGYVSVGVRPGMDIIELIGKKNWGKGIKVTIGESNQLCVECNVIIAYGHSVMTVATAIQEAAVSALVSMTGLDKISVNVNVCGIARQ
jgi:uncharacterized alkaline shock family protein YloU